MMRVVGASIFVASRTVKNRILFAVRRLKRPRYLMSAIVSILYFTMVFGRNRVLRESFNMHKIPIEGMEIVLAIATFAAFILLLVPWAWPSSSSGGVFSDAEIQFLFPAPLKRRDLMIYRQIRNLWGLLISVLVIRFFGRATTFAGTAILFLALDPYMTLVRAARSRLKMIGIGFWLRLVAVLALVAGTIWMLVLPVKAQADVLLTKPHLGAYASTMPGLKALVKLVTVTLQSGPLRLLFFLPRCIALAALSHDPATMAVNGFIVLAVGVMSFLIAARIDTSYEEASIERSRAKSAMTEMRLSHRRGQRVVARALPAPFKLHADGPPAVAIFWKNLIAAGRVYIGQLFILVVIMVPFLLLNIFGRSTRASSAMSLVGMLLLIGSGVLLLVGANMFRNDLRGDLQKLDIIRTYPLTGAALVGAEIAAPATLLSLLQILFVGGGGLLLLVNHIITGAVYSLAATAVVLVGIPLIVVQITIHNAWALLLPGWSFTGREDNRGFAATGQAILMLLGQFLILTVTLLLPAIAFFLSYGLFRFLLHISTLTSMSLSLIIPSAILVMEIYAAVQWLGTKFEELDLANDDLAPQ